MLLFSKGAIKLIGFDYPLLSAAEATKAREKRDEAEEEESQNEASGSEEEGESEL